MLREKLVAQQPVMANQLLETVGHPPKEASQQVPLPPPIEIKIIKTEAMEAVNHEEPPDILGKENTDKGHLERSGFTEKEDVDEEDEDDYLGHDYANGVDDERFSPVSGNIDFGMMSSDVLRTEDFQPFWDVEGNQVLEVDCGCNRALLYVNKLCQGSKGQSILFENRWHTPNEFQYISGRETAKDWKRSIRHRGKSLKILMSRGLLQARSRPSDKRSSLNGCLTNANSATDKKPLKHKLGIEAEPSQLNQIINHLHQTNGSHLLANRDGSRKRSLPADFKNGKHSRSSSPIEGDIYDEQQRCIFQAANSPEPQNIENARKSLNLSANSPESPFSSTSGQSSPVSFVLSNPQSVPPSSDKQESSSLAHKSRKQNSPQHFESQETAGDSKEREVSRNSHIVLVSSTNAAAFQKGQPTLQRQRFHSHQPGARLNGNLLFHGPHQLVPTSQGGEGNGRRTQSLVAIKIPSVKMIELTRPDSVPKTPVFPEDRNSSSHDPAQTADSVSPSIPTSGNDAVFLPSDMSLWTVDDVAQFIQSLNGCEEYVQVFRDQAIDGEILPVLTEEHLLQNMGLKLGPALKIRLRVARRLGYTLDGQYCQLKPPYEELTTTH